MDLLLPQKKDAFESLLAGFSPSSLEPVNRVVASGLSPAQLLRYVDEDTARLDALSRALKSRRNECAPLLSIPPEIIGAILELCSCIEPPKPHSREHGHPTIGWIRLSHICSHLRNIMLSTPTLWAHAAFSLPNACDEMLLRSNGVPITINLLKTPYSHRLSLNLRAQTYVRDARAIFMEINTFKAVMHDTVQPSGSEIGFPVLNALTLKSLNRMSTNVPIAEMPMIHAPLLRHLTLDNCLIQCDFSHLYGLDIRSHDRERVMDFGTAHQTLSVDADTLFGMLGSLRNLRTLKLSGNVLKPFSTTFSLGTSSTSLEQLEHLWLNAESAFCSSLLSKLDIPRLARLSIDLDVDSRRQRQFSTWDMMDMMMITPIAFSEDQVLPQMQLVENAIRQLRLTGPSTVDGIRLDCATSRLTLFKPDGGAFSGCFIGPLSQDHVCVGDMYMQLKDPLILLERVHQHLQLRPPTILELARTTIASSTRWRHILAHYDAVHTLVLDAFPPPVGLWEAICPASTPATGSESPGAYPALPNLRVLFFTTIQRFSYPPEPPPPLTVVSAESDEDSDGEDDEDPPGLAQQEEAIQGAVGDVDVGVNIGGANLDTDIALSEEQAVGDEAFGEVYVNTNGAHGSSSPSRVTVWRRLVDGIRLRAQRGYGIERIVLGTYTGDRSESTMEQMLRDDLRDVVSEVRHMEDWL